MADPKVLTGRSIGDARGSGPEAAALDAAAGLDQDPAHSRRVARLSLSLFDSLSALHGFGRRERVILSVAALLHDVGWADRGAGPHHKRSRRMIEGMELGLEERDRALCALVARYHTKAEPDSRKHRRFGGLGPEDRRRVVWLSGILRICDGLDCSHTGRVRRVSCGISRRGVKLDVFPRGAKAEVLRAIEKSGLLRKAIGTDLSIE